MPFRRTFRATYLLLKDCACLQRIDRDRIALAFSAFAFTQAALPLTFLHEAAIELTSAFVSVAVYGSAISEAPLRFGRYHIEDPNGILTELILDCGDTDASLELLLTHIG